LYALIVATSGNAHFASTVHRRSKAQHSTTQPSVSNSSSNSNDYNVTMTEEEAVDKEFIARYRAGVLGSGFRPHEINETALKRRRVHPTVGPLQQLLTGPAVTPDNDLEPVQVVRDLVAARTISTYPLRADRSGAREGDPICDRYGFSLYHNRSLALSLSRSLALSLSRPRSGPSSDAVLCISL
jgi:hypothetical protein